MGHRHFGNLAKVRRLVYFGLSPFEQRTFPNYFSKGIPNILRRMKRQLFLIVPPVYTAFYLIKWSKDENNRFSRKNPADYVDDQ